MMKRICAFAVLCVLCLSMCGAPEEAADVTPAEPKTGEEIAYAPLTEPEIQMFIKTYPVIKDEVEKAGKKFAPEGEATDVMSALNQMGTINMEIAGLDAKLKAANTTWEGFYHAMYKVMMAAGASMIMEQKEEIAAAKEQLNDPNIPEAQKEMMKGMFEGLDEAIKVYDKVPQQNVELVKKYWKDLDKLFED
jgi:hypothetical protein